MSRLKLEHYASREGTTTREMISIGVRRRLIEGASKLPLTFNRYKVMLVGSVPVQTVSEIRACTHKNRDRWERSNTSALDRFADSSRTS
jgi:hypothetical protein